MYKGISIILATILLLQSIQNSDYARAQSGGGGSLYNYAPYFTSTGSNFVSIPDSQELRLQQQFTVSAWFRTTMNNNTLVALIVNKGGFQSDTLGTPQQNYGIWITGSNQGVRGKVQAGFEDANGRDYFVTSPNTYNDGQWHYAVLTFNGSTLNLYVDGSLVATRTNITAIPHTSNTPLTIGKDSNGNNRYFIGDVDEVRIYNRALTAQEVSDAYSNGVFASNGLIFYFNSTYPIDTFNIAAVGDFGCTSNTDAVINAIANVDPELVLGLGDYSYTTSPSCWYDKIVSIESKMHNPTTIAMGNHETPNGSSYNLNQEGRNDLLNRFNITKTYYSFDYGNVHFLVLDTESSFGIGSAQYNFAKKDLYNASNNAIIDWIIVYFHKPMYTSPTTYQALKSFRDVYQPLFDQYNVDLVLQAHNHNYQRSKPLKYDSVITYNESTTNYPDYEGEIYITVGTGGKSLYAFNGRADYIVTQLLTYGFLNIDVINNGSTLVIRFYDVNNSIGDSFEISKSRKLH
ncbi:Alkaline phosphatase [archaeon HR04]|nr:Alkaline phosphatase [archaeon HR04]